MRRFTRLVRMQLLVFAAVAVVAIGFVAVHYARIPQTLGMGRYHVTLELDSGGGLYPHANVAYRGSRIGRVTDLTMTPRGAEARLSLDSSYRVPVDLDAHVLSRSAIGEQYVRLAPRTAAGPYLSDGDTIGRMRTTVPEPVGPVLDQVDALLDGPGSGSLEGVVDEAFTGLRGSGQRLRDLVDGLGTLAASAAESADSTGRLIDDVAPLLDAQNASSDAIRQWAASLSSFTGALDEADDPLGSALDDAHPAVTQIDAFTAHLAPVLPDLLESSGVLAHTAGTYNPAIEQILVLYPVIMAATQSAGLPNTEDPAQNTFFAMELNDPPPCTTGFLAPSERRSPTELAPLPTPPGLFCRLPPDAGNAVRGARNLPCIEHPGHRAATVEACRENAGHDRAEDDGGSTPPR